MANKSGVLVSVVGPTAVGKTSFGIELARYFDTHVLSVDSRQFYREMEIGTAKPTEEERSVVPHYFVDNLSIQDYYNAGQFERDALSLLDDLFKTKDVVIAVGGSGLFFKALWDGMDEMPEVDPELREQLNEEFRTQGLGKLTQELLIQDPEHYERVDLKNPQRVIRALEVIRSTGKTYSSFRVKNIKERPFVNLKVGMSMGRETLYERIDLRMDQMIAEGLFGEAEKLYPYKDLTALQTVGYSEIFGFMDGLYDCDETVRLLKRNSRRYAKRQMTWFNAVDDVIWLKPTELNQAISMIEEEVSRL